MKPPHRQFDEILADAVALLGPKAKTNGVPAETCSKLILERMAALREDHQQAGMLSPGTIKKSLDDFVELLRRARREPSARLLGLKYLRGLDMVIHQAATLKTSVPPGSRPRNVTGLLAALEADGILSALGIPATKTGPSRVHHGGGDWYQLTSLLYEAATGASSVDLSQYCREAAALIPRRRR